MEIKINTDVKVALCLVLVLICLITSLYLTVHEYTHPIIAVEGPEHLYNAVLSTQAIGLFCVILCLFLAFLQIARWVHIRWLSKILLSIIIIGAAALMLCGVLDLILQGDFAYTFAYTGTILAIVEAAKTREDASTPEVLVT